MSAGLVARVSDMQKVFLFLIVLIIFTTSVLYIVKKDKKIINQNIHMEKVTFKTADGVNIFGNYYKSSVAGNDKAVILLHQFGKDKTMWGDFPEMLVQVGFSVLVIDLRGHGESVKQEIFDRGEDTEISINYKTMHSVDFAAMEKDVEAARAFLSEDYPFNQSIIGSSIGANLALINANSQTRVVALSPGLDYKGIGLEGKLSQANSNALIIVSDDDSYSLDSGKKIAELTGAKLQTEHVLGHGIAMLEIKPELKQDIISFLTLDKNTMSDAVISMPQSFELSGNTKVGEGSHWTLLIKSSDDVSFVLSGDKGNGEKIVDTQKAKINSEEFKKLFDDIAAAIADEKFSPTTLGGSTGETTGYALAGENPNDFKITEETITIYGIKDGSILIFDDHPAFGVVKNILLNSGFVSGSSGSYVLRNAVTTRTGE